MENELMKVAFNDLRAQHEELRPQIDIAIKQTIESSAFVGGPAVLQFERNFASYCGARFALGVGSGTDALRLALQALEVGPGQAVITVPNSFFATAEAILLVGAEPVFVDIDPTTYTMDPGSLRVYLEEACRPNPSNGRPVDMKSGNTVSTIIPVHLYGFPADMEAILAIAAEHHVDVVEDACQAHGAAYRSSNSQSVINKAGTLGRLGCFSFYPGKNLGAMGEGGAVVTDEEELAQKIRLLRNHGQSEKYHHVLPNGSNGRLDSLQAAILDIKLSQLDEWNAKRRHIAGIYSACLEGSQVTLPKSEAYGEHVYHLFVIQVDRRGQIRSHLEERGIETGLHYPVPIHLQRGLKDFGLGPGRFPVTEKMADRLLSLPMHPHLTPTQAEYVCEALVEVVG